MNYQPLFDLMSQHGLTLLEGEMDEIVDVVNGMQQVKPKRLTFERFKELCVKLITFEASYEALLPYLADEQPELKVCTGCGHKSTDPINKKHLACCPDSNYITLDDYLINSIYRPLARTQFTALGSTTMNPPTKPDPSRLEVAAMLLAGHKANSSNIVTDHTVIGVFELADELIKQAKA